MRGQIRKTLVFIIALAALIGFGWGYYYLHLPTTLPIKTVKVVGEYHFVNRAELQKVVMPFVEKGFFNVNVAAAEKAMRNLPGVKQASIRRIWPDTVEISITEKKPLAQLEGGRFYAQDGTVFKPLHDVKLGQLPLFIGAKSDLPLIEKNYVAASSILKSDHLKIQTIGYDGLGSWFLKTKNGPKITLGKTDFFNRLQKVKTYYFALKAKHPGAVLASIDMRYHEGLAAQFLPNDKKMSEKPDST